MRYAYTIAVHLDGDAKVTGSCTDVEVIEGVLSIRDEVAETERLVAPGFWAECLTTPEAEPLRSVK